MMVTPCYLLKMFFLLFLLLIANSARPLTAHAQQHNQMTCTRVLLSAAPNFRPATDDLHEAAMNNDITSACFLLNSGADANKKGM
jgi:hypothetical protein